MEELRTYINILEEIENMLNILPDLNYDTELEEFYEETYEKVEKHKKSMYKRLERKETRPKI